MSDRATRLKVLRTIASLDEPYGYTIQAHINSDLPQNWLTRRWTWINAFRGLRAGAMYVHLANMERAGLVWSEWSKETYPERGNRRRRYYHLTDEGMKVLADQQSEKDAAE